MDSGFPSKTFSGVRFALAGFNTTDGNALRSKLLSGGGVDVGHYNQTCTHLIVDMLIYDDPICVAARSNGKVVVTGSWVDHSFDIGMLIDSNSVLYRPAKDLNGIPGAKRLVVCLTGYQRQDREDIMTMVDLMGAEFSKPLVANEVTHLICYKFEGEKYELAKRMKTIKLVNHRWLEDCLKNWKLLPEIEYAISGYDLEMMEASAKDSEDEAEDASVKRANNSPLGLRVGDVAAVEMSKSTGKDIAVAQTTSGTGEGSSLCNTSRENWLTPKKMDRNHEAMVSTDAVAARQYSNDRASIFQEPKPGSLKENLRPVPIINDPTDSGEVSHKSPASVKLLSSNVVPKEDAITSENIISKCALDEIPKRSSTGLSGSPKENLRPVPRTYDSTVSGEVGHTSPASVKLLSSNVVPMENAIPTAENIISKCAQSGVLERSPTEPMVGNISLQDPISGSPKQNLKVVPNINDPTKGREVAQKLDLSDSATRLFKDDIWTPTKLKGALDLVPERSIIEPVMKRFSTPSGSGLISMKDQQETELPKKKTTARKSLGTRGRKQSPINQKGSIYLSDPIPKEERTVCLNKGKASAPVTDDGNQKEVASSVLNTEAVPEMAKQIDTKTEALKGIDSADDTSYAPEEKDHLVLDLIVNQDKLQAKTSEEADAEMEITMLEAELTDIPTKDPSDGSLQLEVDKNKSERNGEATVGKHNLQSGKKESSSTVKAGKSSVKKAKKSRKEHDGKINDAVMKDIGENSAVEKENLALGNKSGKVSSGGDHSPVAGETLARMEAETKDPSDAAVQLEVDKNNGNSRKEATVEKDSLQSGKKGSSSTVEFEKPSVKKAESSKIEDDAKATDTVMKHIGNNSADYMENIAVDNEFGDVSSDGTLARKEAAAKDPSNAAMQIEGDKNKRKRGKEATVVRSSVQSGKKGSSSAAEVGKSSVKKTKKSRKERGAKATDTVMNHIGDNSAEEMENITVDNEFGDVSSDETQTPVAGKPYERTEAAAKAPSNAAMQIKVDKNKRKRGKEDTVERSSIQSGKKGSSSTVEVGKSTVKKTKKSKKEKENIVVDNKSGKVGSGGHQRLVSGKPLARKEAAKTAKTGTKVGKESKQLSSKPVASEKVIQDQEQEPKFFTVSGPKAQRKEYQQIIKSLKGKCCRDSHQWSYQATHFIAPEMRRTEKFFAAAASGSWILKTDYVADSKEAGKLLAEEPYEWHSTGLSTDGVINLEAPRKWRLVREQTGHGALYGMRIVVYGDCNFPSLDTLKRAVKAGDGTILATAPPYTRFLNQNTDFALISSGMPHADVWIQEFIRHEIPCVLSDYLVEYVCKPGYPLDKYVLYDTNSWAERSFNKLQLSAGEKLIAEEEEEEDVASPNIDDVACEVCGSTERGEVMLICGDEEGISGCGTGTHIDCCDPPLPHVPEHDWFCSRCNVKSSNKRKKGKC
ncbi:hypothetical protein AALP_AA6G023800 [Arabis alpina]|uniref:BRCT domain-containing protein n=1 Tax=Arabis alpina TaxID=50452 RepID=A0A087GLL7_ARAAL|nr:hypothetical protein AALP_AA6G023800 [Arabis alpina]